MSNDAGMTTTGNAEHGNGQRTDPWRIAGWSAVALILLLPLVAMQFTEEVHWTLADFILAAAFLLGVGTLLELAVRKTSNTAYRWAIGIALITALLLVCVNGAVGIIGSEDNDANLLYGGVLAIGILGALLARLRPCGMARALLATALAQASVAVGAAVAGLGTPYSGALEIVALNGFFVALWVGSASLFRRAHGNASPQSRTRKADRSQV